MAWHDPNNRLGLVRDGVERILRSRLCASTPAQYGYLAGLRESKDWLDKHRKLTEERMNFCLKRIEEIDGLSCESPKGAFYLFVKLTNLEDQKDDKKWVLDLLHQEHVLVVHGSGFSPEFGSGHFRMVCLPPISVLEEAFQRIERFLSS
jgi:aspartate/methionine/tyrosine aminotransferase